MIGLFNESEEKKDRSKTNDDSGYLKPAKSGYVENLLWRDKNAPNDTMKINYTNPKNGYIQGLMKSNIPGWQEKEMKKIVKTNKPDKTRVHAENYYIDKEKDFGFRRSERKRSSPMIAEGQGLSGIFEVSSNYTKKGDDILVMASTINRPEYDMFGDVEVLIDGRVSNKTKLTPSKQGYYYQTGGPKPLGEAVVKLPKKGNIEVRLNIGGNIGNSVGRASNNVSQTIFNIKR